MYSEKKNEPKQNRNETPYEKHEISSYTTRVPVCARILCTVRERYAPRGFCHCQFASETRNSLKRPGKLYIYDSNSVSDTPRTQFICMCVCACTYINLCIGKYARVFCPAHTYETGNRRAGVV